MGFRQAGPELHEALIACTQDIHTVLDADGLVVYQSPSLTEITGWTESEMLGTSGFGYSHPDDVEHLSREFASLIDGSREMLRTEFRMRTKAGGFVHFDSIVRNELDNPAIRGVLIVSRDVSKEVDAQRSLREREHLFRTVEAHPCILVWALDKNGIVTVSQGAGLRLLGLEPGQIVGQNVFEMYADHPQVPAYLRRALDGETLDYTVEIPVPGGIRTMDTRLRPQFSGSGEVIGVTAITFDVSDRHALEDELRRAKTMEAIGMLAGGIAHDFNNLLTAIVGFASAARRAPDETRDGFLKEVVAAGERGGELVSQLLEFARRDEIRPEVIDLATLLENARPLYAQVLGDDIDIHLEISDRARCFIDIDRSKLEQVFLNLVANARDAMPGGGSLTIRLSHDESTGDTLCVRAEVTDTGVGMSADVQDCVFEPFYSTKERGTGLGLATTHGIVTRAGGQISVDSTEGVGTTFVLRFPCADARLGAEQPEKPRAEPVRGDAATASSASLGRLLLVDDNKAVLSSTALSLEFFGYEVRTAESGQEAFDIYVANADDIDLVITDMTMPGMKGDELAERIREIDSTVPILCVSGHHESSPLIESLDGVSTLSKPYIGDALQDMVSRLLSGDA